MKQAKFCSIVTLGAIIFVGFSSARANTLSYVLLSGSTITPLSDGMPSGPAQALSGTFTWTGPDSNEGFNATALFFSSQSITLSLDQTAANNFETYVSQSSSVTNFGEIVDMTGLSITLGMIQVSTMSGNYTGPSTGPTFVNNPNLIISPPGGGPIVARLSFSAQVVPEPSTFILAVCGLFGFVFMVRRRLAAG